MRRFFSEMNGVTLLVGSLIERGIDRHVPVYFERVSAGDDFDFDFAEGTVPSCWFSRTSGFSELELARLREYLRDNMLLIFEFAQEEAARPEAAAPKSEPVRYIRYREAKSVIAAMDKRVEQLGLRSRSDYFRLLVRRDLEREHSEPGEAGVRHTKS